MFLNKNDTLHVLQEFLRRVFVQPLSISGVTERPTVKKNQHNETKQCDSWS